MNTLLTELSEHTALLQERDTSDIWRQFAIWLLVDEDLGVIRFTTFGSKQYNAINRVAQLYIEDCKDVKRWKEAYVAAWYAADAAYYAANSAYYAAWCATAAAHAAAEAADVAYAAWSAARSADAAWSAATDAHYKRMADKLIELINAAPLKETI